MSIRMSQLPKHVRDRATVQGGKVERKPTPRGMNGLERAYADHLRMLEAGGVVSWWAFQPWRLRITRAGGRDRFYTPDFVVVYRRNGEVEFHETKGFMREAAQLRLAMAADLYPFPFFVVRRVGSNWTCQRIARAAAVEVLS